MSDTTKNEASPLRTGPTSLRDAVDLWGADFSKWTDIAQVRRAREALLSDRVFRAYRDGAVEADRKLKVAAGALDQRIASHGSVARIAGQVMTRVAPRERRPYSRYAAVAAVIVVAGVLGGASQWARIDRADSAQMAVVQLDPLLFGPSELGF